MNTFLADPMLSGALAVLIKVSLIVGVAAVTQIILRWRASAATRHLVWTLATGGMLLLPLLSTALPEWTVVIRTAAVPTAVATPIVSDHARESADVSIPPTHSTLDATVGTATGAKAAAVRPSWSAIIPIIYGIGAFVLLIHLVLQQWSIKRLAREADEVQDPEWTRALSDCALSMRVVRPVRLLRSRARSMPMAFGLRRPAILIPAVADMWPADRRRAVILHELAHVARYDCLTQMLAFVACAMYWFHPAVWWAAQRLRTERELACDDRVIAAGTQPREYAGHLLEIAYAFGSHRAPALAVSMARPRQLEGRMLAVLDTARNRRVPAARARVTSLAIAAALLLPLAAVTATSVAANPERDRTSDAATEKQRTTETKTEKQPITARHLKEIPSTAEMARRVVRAAAAAIGVSQAIAPGTWEIRPSKTSGTVHLRLVELNSQTGMNVPIDQLEGLSATHLTGPGGQVQFRLRRDAGTLTFEGVFRNGVGAGTFSYTADPNFPAELAKRGFARPTAQEQYQMARHDIGFAFVDELNKQGYAKTTTAELVRAGQHGVRADYVREMAAFGYRLGSLESLITLRDHGVTPSYVRELGEQGFKAVPAEELRRARDHGITPEFVRAMREAGYASLTMEQLITARDHGITAEYVSGMREAGYRSLTLEQLVNARDHGVTVEFVRELGAAGYGNLPVEQLVRARDHGVSPQFVRDMRQLGHTVALDELIRARDHGVNAEFARGMTELGYRALSIDALVRLRDHGVTTKYVQDLKALGYENVAIDDLVTLRNHGLTADRIRSANARAGTRLPIDLLKSLAAGGMR